MDSPVLTVRIDRRDGTHDEKVFVLDSIDEVLKAACFLDRTSSKLTDIIFEGADDGS